MPALSSLRTPLPALPLSTPSPKPQFSVSHPLLTLPESLLPTRYSSSWTSLSPCSTRSSVATFSIRSSSSWNSLRTGSLGSSQGRLLQLSALQNSSLRPRRLHSRSVRGSEVCGVPRGRYYWLGNEQHSVTGSGSFRGRICAGASSPSVSTLSGTSLQYLHCWHILDCTLHYSAIQCHFMMRNKRMTAYKSDSRTSTCEYQFARFLTLGTNSDVNIM